MRKLIYLTGAAGVILIAALFARTVQPTTVTAFSNVGIDIQELHSAIDVKKLPKVDVAEPY